MAPCMLHRAETNYQLARQGYLSQSSIEVPGKRWQIKY